MKKNLNVFGEPLITCSLSPKTGYFRTGCCESDESDIGMYTVCVIVNEDFLLFSKVSETICQLQFRIRI